MKTILYVLNTPIPKVPFTDANKAVQGAYL